jgi:acetylornithine deacetylase/succinyl-diaminopimelate desuccinylase-like protein
MSAGASDDVFVNDAGLASYAITGIAIEHDDERMHGQDERLGVESFYKGNEFFYRYLKAVTAK